MTLVVSALFQKAQQLCVCVEPEIVHKAVDLQVAVIRVAVFCSIRMAQVISTWPFMPLKGF